MSADVICQVESCGKSAKYYCSCQISICESHLDCHLTEYSWHSIVSISLSSEEKACISRGIKILRNKYTAEITRMLSDNNTKIQGLLCKIRKLEQKYSEKVVALTKRYSIITDLANDLLVSDRNIEFQDKFIQSILEIKFNSKHLTDNEVENTLEKYVFSTPDHDNTYDFPATDKRVTIYDKTLAATEIPYPDFNQACRCLYLGNSTILITGGIYNPTLACRVSIDTQKITLLPPLKIPRKWTAMAFIENKPAVIGGAPSNSLEGMTSVELFEEEWTEGAPINIPRNSHSAARNEEITYIFGGYHINTSHDTVEKYMNGEWIVLNAKLPFCGSSIGVWHSKGKGFLILGGYDAQFQPSEKVYLWNEDKVEVLPELEKKVGFWYNMWMKEGRSIVSVDHTHNFIKYKLNS